MIKKNLKFISILIIILFTLPIVSCKTPVIQEEEMKVEEAEVITEEIDKKEKITEEFNESMIINRLMFPDDAEILEEDMKSEEKIPLWYIQEYEDEFVKDHFIISGVVAGPFENRIGRSGEKEILLPLAFKNPDTEKFFIRYISFGTSKVHRAQEKSGGGVPAILLHDYYYMGEEYFIDYVDIEEIKDSFMVGDQVAFLLGRYLESLNVSNEILNSEYGKVIFDFYKRYYPANDTLYNAMIKNEDPPESIYSASVYIVNREENIESVSNNEYEEDMENEDIKDEEISNNETSLDIRFPIKIKTLVLNYDPKLQSQGDKYLHEVCGFNDPKELAHGYISDLNGCSGGKVIYEIVDWIDINDMIPYTDGFQYTGESFYENFQKASSERWDWWGWNGWHAHEKNQASGMADFFWIISTNNLVERINSGEIDEVLVFAQPFSGMYESIMIGPNPVWCNSNPLASHELDRNFIMMGFNYHRDVGCMLESYGHRVESILTYVFEKDSRGINYWKRFTLYDKVAPGEAGCGNIHYAPNSDNDYDWGNKRSVYSTCDDWLNYPNLKGEKREVNCSEWGNGDMRLHHIWWLSHIPKAEGLDSNGMLNNWWGYFTKMF